MSSEGPVAPVFKTITGRNYMEFAFNNESELISYQLEMIAHNSIEGLLNCEVIRIDGRVHLAYDITSLISLGKFFERRVFIRAEFLDLIRQITVLLKGLNGYLLDSGGVLFNSHYIFIDPQSLRLSFAYLPQKDIPDSLEPLKNMLLETIIHHIRFANEMTDNFIQKLIELLKDKELTIGTLQNYYREMETMESPALLKPMPLMAEHNRKESSPSDEERGKAKAAPLPPKPSISQNSTPKVSETKKGFPAKSYYIMGSVIPVFLLFGIVLVINKTLSPDNPDFFLSLFGYLIMGGAIIYLIYSKLFSPDKCVELKIENKPLQANERSGTRSDQQNNIPKRQPVTKTSLYMPSRRIMPDTGDIPGREMDGPIEYVNKAFSIPRPFQSHNEAAVTIRPPEEFDQKVFSSRQPGQAGNKEQDHTMLLDAGHLKHPSLKKVHSSESLCILMTHFPFMIGRLSGQVDYCLNNPAVGKMHVELKKTQEGIFVTDMNSRNGSLINGERLEPNRDYRLENGDRLTLANEEFIFSQGQDGGI